MDNLTDESFGNCRFGVGATVYYRSPESRYAIRKSTVKEVTERCRLLAGRFPRTYYVLALESGKIVRSSEAFASLQEAYEVLAAEIKLKLTFQQVQMENLKHEMAYEAAALQRIEHALA